MTCKECHQMLDSEKDITDHTLAEVAASMTHLEKCKRCRAYRKKLCLEEASKMTYEELLEHQEACAQKIGYVMDRIRADPEVAPVLSDQSKNRGRL
jgi:hypothetical protein